MEVHLKLNDQQVTARILHTTGSELAFIDEWREQLGNDRNPFRRDAVDFAELARVRYVANNATQPYARSIDEFGDHVVDNPHCEVACLVYLTCDWFPPCGVIGLSHFRRTWCNRIVLDYLCAHPFITKPPANYVYRVKGVGLALLYFVAQVAKTYNADLLWGEATQNSCGFYEKVLALESVKDLIIAPRENYMKFCADLESAWTGSEKASVLDKIYEIEEEHPPFVGNKTAVHSPYQILVTHFLALPLPRKVEIAAAFGLGVADLPNISDADLFRQILRQAQEKNDLASLWVEIEGRHDEGAPDANPFTNS